MIRGVLIGKPPKPFENTNTLKTVPKQKIICKKNLALYTSATNSVEMKEKMKERDTICLKRRDRGKKYSSLQRELEVRVSCTVAFH